MTAAAHAARQGAPGGGGGEGRPAGRLRGAFGGDPLDGAGPAHLRAGLPAGGPRARAGARRRVRRGGGAGARRPASRSPSAGPARWASGWPSGSTSTPCWPAGPTTCVEAGGEIRSADRGRGPAARRRRRRPRSRLVGPERAEQPAGSVLLATGGFQGDPDAVREFLGPGAERDAGALEPRLDGRRSADGPRRRGGAWPGRWTASTATWCRARSRRFEARGLPPPHPVPLA